MGFGYFLEKIRRKIVKSDTIILSPKQKFGKCFWDNGQLRLGTDKEKGKATAIYIAA